MSTPRPPYIGISRPRQNTYFAADHNKQNGKQTTNQNIKASKYHMRALGTAATNSNTINIILHNHSYLPAVQWPKWQQIFTSSKWQANNKSKHHMRALGTTAAPNSNTINIILHHNSYLPAVQWPKWQQICTSPNGQATNNNNLPALQWPMWQPDINTHPLNKINKFKPEASTELWEQQPSEYLHIDWCCVAPCAPQSNLALKSQR